MRRPARRYLVNGQIARELDRMIDELEAQGTTEPFFLYGKHGGGREDLALVERKGDTTSMATCVRCGGTMAPQTVATNKKRGAVASVLWTAAAVMTCGIILLIPLLTRKGSKAKTFMVCTNCGHRRTA
jgi:hypothetical protein